MESGEEEKSSSFGSFMIRIGVSSSNNWKHMKN